VNQSLCLLLTDEDLNHRMSDAGRCATHGVMMRQQQQFYVAAVISLVVSVKLGSSTSSSRVCPLQCRCLDHDSIVNCHNAGVDQLPSPLPSAAIVVDADRNRISALYVRSILSPGSLILLFL